MNDVPYTVICSNASNQAPNTVKLISLLQTYPVSQKMMRMLVLDFEDADDKY